MGEKDETERERESGLPFHFFLSFFLIFFFSFFPSLFQDCQTEREREMRWALPFPYAYV